jgi:exodeoxyribonuclease VII large subunit
MFCVRDRLRSEHASLRGALQRMELQGTHVLSQAARDLQTKRQLLDAYNPQRRLEQGWALVRDQEGRVVTSITTVTADQRLVVQLSDGKIETQVRSIEESV